MESVNGKEYIIRPTERGDKTKPPARHTPTDQGCSGWLSLTDVPGPHCELQLRGFLLPAGTRPANNHWRGNVRWGAHSRRASGLGNPGFGTVGSMPLRLK